MMKFFQKERCGAVLMKMKTDIKSTVQFLASQLNRHKNIEIDRDVASPSNTQHSRLEQNPTCTMKVTIQGDPLPKRAESNRSLSVTTPSGYIQPLLLKERAAEEDVESTIQFCKRVKLGRSIINKRAAEDTLEDSFQLHKRFKLEVPVQNKLAEHEPHGDQPAKENISRKSLVLDGNSNIDITSENKSDSTSAMSIDEEPLHVCECKYKNITYLMARSHYHIISSIYGLRVDPKTLPSHHQISCDILWKAMTDVVDLLEEEPHGSTCFLFTDQTSNTM